MMIIKKLLVGVVVPCALCFASGEQTSPALVSASEKPTSGTAVPGSGEKEARAAIRYEEMLSRMQTAVEEIAQLYGNPIFLQVFTNDTERAVELKERLKNSRRTTDIRTEIESLERQRSDLLNDIALKEKQVSKLGDKLVRQRVALDSLAAAVEQARKAVEDTTR